MIPLKELVSELPSVETKGSLDLIINNITYDSRRVSQRDLFVAIKGFRRDGHDFIQEAIDKGAVAVVTEKDYRSHKATVIRVPSSRKALALLSRRYYDFPSQRMRLIGITGTNGKTTTCYLVKSILEAAGFKTGLLGTIEYRIGDRIIGEGRTTPESLDLNRLLREMVEVGAKFAVLEVSSHALALDRVYGLDFRAGVFTNLSQDHLDFHKDMESYLRAKSLLFESLRPDGSSAIINLDDPCAGFLIERTKADVITYSLKKSDATIRVEWAATRGDRVRIKIASSFGNFELISKLRGWFNVYNITASVATALALGLEKDPIIRGIEGVENVKGRLERVDCGQDFDLFIDYAHTPDALANCLKAIREMSRGRIIVLFGCGGERDREKRPKMGAIAESLADFVIITSDNPRGEDPKAIIRDIDMGIKDKSKREILPDRREAIARALELAKNGDTVLLAGKGHETYQEIGGERIEFNDRGVAEEILKHGEHEKHEKHGGHGEHGRHGRDLIPR